VSLPRHGSSFVPPENHIQLANLNFQTGSFLGFGSEPRLHEAARAADAAREVTERWLPVG